MARKAAILIPVILAAIIVGVIGIIFAPSELTNKTNIDFPKGTVRINDDVVTVEIAQTLAQKQRWLMFRDQNPALDSAMILKYDKPDLESVWLLDIQYNLDLVWFDENGTAVYLIKNAPPCKSILETVDCTYKNTKPALYVIAASAGFIEKHKITYGSKMTFISV